MHEQPVITLLHYTGRSVAASNLVNVFAHLYACSLIGPEVLYGLLDALRAGFAEHDVALIASILRACGARLRADDPVAMKAFVVSVHARAAEAAKEGPLSARTEAMLGLVLDVKNNRAKQGSTARALSPTAARWVAGCGVSDMQLRNLSWTLLLEEHKTVRGCVHARFDAFLWKPSGLVPLLVPLVPLDDPLCVQSRQHHCVSQGRWWEGRLQPLDAPAPATDSAASPEDELGAERLRALAARLRLNTETRRMVFYAVMGSSDVVDATERLLRLPLKVCDAALLFVRNALADALMKTKNENKRMPPCAWSSCSADLSVNQSHRGSSSVRLFGFL